MKSKLALVALVSSFIFHHSSFAQGSLTPPGAPAVGMKSLAQIEPRTPISAVPFTITNSGSYYLTANLNVSSGNAITIATNGVTLDLNGFTLASTEAAATGTGILLTSDLSDLTIVNGHIMGGVTNNGNGVYTGSGFGYGIGFSGNAPANTVVARVSVSGCRFNGIKLNTGNSTVVENCTVQTVGSYGIYAATIRHCSAADCGAIAIAGEAVSDSRGQSSNGTGLQANTALNCNGYSTSNYGLFAYTAQNCYGYSSSSIGLYGYYTASGCYGYSANSTGLYAFIANVCHGASLSGTALSVTHNVNSF